MPMTRPTPGCAHRPGEAAAAAGDVVEVHRLADDEVAVGVEAAPELGAVVLEVALDLELLPEAERVGAPGSTRSRPKRSVNTLSLRNVTWATIRAMARPVGRARRLAGVVVVAAAPVRVELDRPAADGAPGDLLGRRLHAGRDGDDRAHPLRVHDRPLEDLHPAHRAADDGVPAGDAEVVGEPGLDAHHVADRDDREARAVRPAVDGVRRRRAGRALAAAEHVGAHDEPAVGVDRRPGPTMASHQPGVGVAATGRAGDVAVARPGVAEEHGVGAVGVERAPRLVGDGDVGAAWRRCSRANGRSGASVKNCAVAGGSPGIHAPVLARHRAPVIVPTDATSTLVAGSLRPHPACGRPWGVHPLPGRRPLVMGSEHPDVRRWCR